MTILQKKYDDLKRDTLSRIEDLQFHLEGLTRNIERGSPSLNDLGELQGVPMLLEARIGALAVVSNLLDEEKEKARQMEREPRR